MSRITLTIDSELLAKLDRAVGKKGSSREAVAVVLLESALAQKSRAKKRSTKKER